MKQKEASIIIGAPVDPSREHHPDVEVYNEDSIHRIINGIECDSSLEAMTASLLIRAGIPVRRGKTVELGGSGLWYTPDFETPHMVVDPHIVDKDEESRLRKETQMAAFVRGTGIPILIVHPNGKMAILLRRENGEVRYRKGTDIVIARCQHCGRLIIVPHRGDGIVECPDCGAKGFVARLLYDGAGHSLSAIKSKQHNGRMSWMEFWCHYGRIKDGKTPIFGEMWKEDAFEYVRESNHDYR